MPLPIPHFKATQLIRSKPQLKLYTHPSRVHFSTNVSRISSTARHPNRTSIITTTNNTKNNNTNNNNNNNRTSQLSNPALPKRVITSRTRLSHFSTVSSLAARTMSSSAVAPSFSEGDDVASLSERLRPLLKGSEGGGRWSLIESGRGLERGFKFKGFKKTWEFMNAVAAQCVVAKHHPEWSNVYNTTFIRWTTHSPSGLSSKDIAMADFCDEQAAKFGEVLVTEDGDEGAWDGQRALADRVAVEGGDCCVPKSKQAL